MANQDFSGAWRSYHWYPTSDDTAEESSEYQMTAHKKGHEVVFESVDGKGESYMLIRLTIDGNIATGTWHENAEMHGPFKGMMYSGAGQLIISEDGNSMDGMWAGAGIDHATEKPRIYTGRWELKRL